MRADFLDRYDRMQRLNRSIRRPERPENSAIFLAVVAGLSVIVVYLALVLMERASRPTKTLDCQKCHYQVVIHN